MLFTLPCIFHPFKAYFFIAFKERSSSISKKTPGLHDYGIYSITFIYGLLLIKICMNANIMKTNVCYRIIYDLKCHFYVTDLLT